MRFVGVHQVVGVHVSAVVEELCDVGAVEFGVKFGLGLTEVRARDIGLGLGLGSGLRLGLGLGLGLRLGL